MGGDSDEVPKSWPVSYRTINPYGGITCRPSFASVNPGAIKCVSGTDVGNRFEYATCRREKFVNPRGKRLRIQKIAATCRRGLNHKYKSNQTTIEQTKANPNKTTTETALKATGQLSHDGIV